MGKVAVKCSLPHFFYKFRISKKVITIFVINHLK
nr:MAG TPA: hypothetical protein [Crassvirales sp.]